MWYYSENAILLMQMRGLCPKDTVKTGSLREGGHRLEAALDCGRMIFKRGVRTDSHVKAYE